MKVSAKDIGKVYQIRKNAHGISTYSKAILAWHRINFVRLVKVSEVNNWALVENIADGISTYHNLIYFSDDFIEVKTALDYILDSL